MAPNTYSWISAWFLLTTPVIIWDAFYCLLRPRSMVGGDLHWIWEPYSIYQEVDYVYGVKALQENNGFTSAQSLLNLIETALNVLYVYLAHVSKYPGASIVGFASAVMTLSKTVLYWAQEYYCSFCSIGHNDLKTLVVYWIIPNGLWIVLPTLIVLKLGKDIAASINVAAQVSAKKASGKMQ
ncbi:hypothetical protein BC834DRAFT_862609 [Gloeopeniophorella convolvens]|nr:hypothetical protein BC834DRAFT_862609 [Gloeopeniophorella convolvens]